MSDKPSAQIEKLFASKAEVDALLVEPRCRPHQLYRWHAGGENPDHRRDRGAHVREVRCAGATSAIEKAHAASSNGVWVPAPKRGELVRPAWRRAAQQQARRLAGSSPSEAGKIESEGLGEVQEMIDICDYAVGIPGSSSA